MSTLVAAPIRERSVVIVTPDTALLHSLTDRLQGLRWRVFSASGGAEAMVHFGELLPEAMIVDHWLPDLDAEEFADYAASISPGTDMLQMDGSSRRSGARSARRNELLHALREAHEEAAFAPAAHLAAANLQPSDGAAWLQAPITVSEGLSVRDSRSHEVPLLQAVSTVPPPLPTPMSVPAPPARPVEVRMHLPEMVGDSTRMRELAQLVRMVAPHAANVLIQGETGTGKELVAKAVHRLSGRAGKPFAVLNCAAIPEHLLEAELFGHARGAFTGAVTSRTGRIEAAHGGTLFLDEIGEMPLPLQSKMLRFLENGEIQKVGENDVLRVDVRIVAATHQPLEEYIARQAGERKFRLDLYHRLAVFPVDLPSLRDRSEDIPMLVEHFLRKLGESGPRRSIAPEALHLLSAHAWPGNVRELGHAMQRAVILCGDSGVIRPEHIRLGSSSGRTA